MATTKEMHEDIDRAIHILTGKIVQSVDPIPAMNLTQAAVNLAHLKGLLGAIEKERTAKTVTKPTKGAG